MKNKVIFTTLVTAGVLLFGGAGAHAAPTPAMVTVTPGDTLSSIAEAHDTTYPRLFDANESIAHPDYINPGQELRVPTADEELPDRMAAVVSVPVVAQSVAVSQRTYTPAPAPAVGGGVWDRLAQCEAGGNWAINTGNGYSGGLQFAPGTWTGNGGGVYAPTAGQASREQQIAIAEKLVAKSGYNSWPACADKLGLR
ncbi:MAG: transglycosylase family protein [Candidatus Saccharimonadales bacterium]